ncbi:MAG: hypothetical protein WAK34_08560, partial [Rhodoplanes sp.]
MNYVTASKDCAWYFFFGTFLPLPVQTCELRGRAMKTEQETLDVLVFVEKDGADRFKIRSGQLEQIGEKLRGFSVFNS